MRAEGTNELAGDVNFGCLVGTGGAVSITVFASAPVTSPVNAGTGKSEAVLFVCNNSTTACASGTGTPLYASSVSGSQIVFAVPVGTITTNFTGIIQNVRVNASAVTLGSTVTTVTETVLASVNNTSQATSPATTGFVFPSLTAPALTTLTGLTTQVGSTTLTAYTTCAGNPLSSTRQPTISFAVKVAEAFGGAFKVGTNGANSEGGSYAPSPGTAGTVGTASFGTRIQLAFANIPNSATIYVPTSVSGFANGSSLILNLTTSATGAFAAVPSLASGTSAPAGAPTGSTVIGTSNAFTAGVPLTASNGSATAVYEVVSSNPAVSQSVSVPVFVVFNSNAIVTAPPAITVLESYAPTAAAAAATTVPNFAPPSNTALTANLISLCSTNLLFPFVTSVTGFDTGIALSNTSADPFGTTAAAGSCALNFYGTGAPTPSTGVAAPGGSQAGGSSTAFLLSSVAPNFTGYLIAQCTYQYGHGFAYIVYNFGQGNGATMGYLATVMSGGRVPAAAESLGE